VRRVSESEIWRLGDSTQIVWRAAADGSRFVAPTWTDVTGQRQEELDAAGWLASVHPEDRARVANDWSEALRGGHELMTEFRVRLKDGSYQWFRSRGEAMRNRRGEVKRWIGITWSIDDQRRMEEALRESVKRLKLIVDSARVGIMDWDLEADELDMNLRARELLGLPTEAPLTIDAFERVVDPEDRMGLRAAIDVAVDPSGSGHFEAVFRVRRPDRQLSWIAGRGSVRFVEDQERRRGVRLVGAITDLSREMRELEERAWLASLVASSSDAIIAQTPEGGITHWNAAAERIFGYSAQEMIGQSIFRIVPPDQVAEHAAHLSVVRRGGDVSNATIERVGKDGRRIVVALTLSPIRDANGLLIGLSAIERDITDDRFREAQLREAQKLETVGRLAAGVAHDLNNTMTALMAGVHLVIQQPGLDARASARLAQVRDDCFRASSVIRELLAFGRKQALAPHVCRPNDIVREAEPMLNRLLGEDIELELELRAERGVFVDRALMLQVIVSLATQARDSMPIGGRVTISTNDEAPLPGRPPRRVLFTITDTGTGLPADTQARLFDPYYATRKLGWGTGLGLSVVHGIVSQFGGTIAVDSPTGEGTTFTISLPAFDPRTPAPVTPANPLQFAGGVETILLVEDERVLRDQLAQSLRQLGYTVIEARNGNDALTALERHSAVDFVLSDIVMPGMNGVALVAQLRERYPDVRALFMTGYSEEAAASYGVVSGAALLMKPFVISELAARIRSVLDGSRQPGGP
jgi:PAS domain S-box-containing protein